MISAMGNAKVAAIVEPELSGERIEGGGAKLDASGLTGVRAGGGSGASLKRM